MMMTWSMMMTSTKEGAKLQIWVKMIQRQKGQRELQICVKFAQRGIANMASALNAIRKEKCGAVLMKMPSLQTIVKDVGRTFFTKDTSNP